MNAADFTPEIKPEIATTIYPFFMKWAGDRFPDDANGIVKAIMGLAGHANSSEFKGNPAGTVVLQGVDIHTPLKQTGPAPDAAGKQYSTYAHTGDIKIHLIFWYAPTWIPFFVGNGAYGSADLNRAIRKPDGWKCYFGPARKGPNIILDDPAWCRFSGEATPRTPIRSAPGSSLRG